MSENTLKKWYAEGSNEVMLEYRHGRSEYVARVRLQRIDGPDGGVLIDTSVMDEGSPVIPTEALLEAIKSLDGSDEHVPLPPSYWKAQR